MTATLRAPIVFLLALATANSGFADDQSARARLRTELQKVGTAYSGKRFREIEKAFVEALKKRDAKKWRDLVNESGDEKRRKSFLGEYFAYSGDYELQPLKDSHGEPVLTKKHKLRLLVFRPGKPVGKNEPLSKKQQEMTYLIIRSHVPFGDENPYGIFVSQALKGYSAQQLKNLVETYRDDL